MQNLTEEYHKVLNHNFDNVNKIVMIVIYEIFVIVISYIVTFAISKIPKIGKYILYIK